MHAQIEMKQSEKLMAIQRILSGSAVKNMLNLIRAVTDKHNDFAAPTFIQSQDYKFLLGQLDKMVLPQICDIMNQIKQPNTIIALPVKMQPKFTLFFVVVPKGQMFDWHSHPHMTGISKCLHGHFQITSLDIKVLEKIGDTKRYSYQSSKQRKQQLKVGQTNSVSNIDPIRMNIHRIQAKVFSAFFDLLMPDYPQNYCNFFRTVQEGQKLIIQQIGEPGQVIKGWDEAINDRIHQQKCKVVQNVILQ